MSDDWNAPLGQDTPGTSRAFMPFSAAQALAALLGLILIGFGLWTVRVDLPLRHGPAVASSSPRPGTEQRNPRKRSVAAPAGTSGSVEPAGPAQGAAAPKDPNFDTASANGTIVTIIDGTNGSRQKVILPASQDRIAAPAEAPPGPR